MSRSARNAFTLVEVMIVVVIMAILAATIIPQFTSSTDDARESTAMFNLHTLRSQIQLYRAEHGGRTPAADLGNLLIATDATGAAGSDFGPYLQVIPTNPFTGSNKVTEVTGETPTATGASDAGWLYKSSTGEIWLDHADYLNR